MDKNKNVYSILMPPPNLTGEPHCGHMIQYLIMDALARHKRMQGFDVLFQPGVDHAGIQFEGTFNKLLEKEGLSKQKLGREKWIERAWEFKDQIYKSFHQTWKMMGISADWDKEVFTLDPKVQKTVFEEFKRFWDEGLLYKGEYIIAWCPKDQTAIEDVEMEYEERKEKLYFVKYPIQGSENQFIIVATARPETMFVDVAIAVHPTDTKYKNLNNRHAINPLNEQVLPIIKDKRVDKKFGTGALKITPFHDPIDFQIGKENSLPLNYQAIDKIGRMTEFAFLRDDDMNDSLSGMKSSEAREKVVEWLNKHGFIEKAEDYVHSVPVCERCKTTIEPLISEEWFVKMDSLAKKAIENIKARKIKFYPSHYDEVILEWLDKIHDWSISRSLWWGHRIPVWYCEKCNPNHEVGKDKPMQVSLEKPKKECEQCKSSEWVQDEQILDTWFSSGMWPLATLGWPEKSDDFGKYFPWSFEISAPEIKYLWIARMIMLSLHFENQIPFETMFFTGTLRDIQGKKFSKSLGNGLYPKPFVDQWGVDSLRMTLFSYAAPARDGRASKQTLDERCKNFRNFATKLRNIYRFIYELRSENTNTLSKFDFRHPDDAKVLEELKITVDHATKRFEKFELHLATEKIYDFIWHDFADKYIEASKNRRVEAQPCLEKVFKQCLLLLYPFMPFLAEELYLKLPEHKASIYEERKN